MHQGVIFLKIWGSLKCCSCRMVKCARFWVCVCLCVLAWGVCPYTHTQAELNYRPVQWPALYHLDLCCLMLSKICLIKGMMVVRREVILTFETNAHSHYPSCNGVPQVPWGTNDALTSSSSRGSLEPVPTTWQSHSLKFTYLILVLIERNF